MIRLNLMEAAERVSVLDVVTPVRVTDVSAQVKTSKKKTLLVAVAALFVFGVFSCFISVFGVPQPLQGILPGPYLALIGAEDPSRSALTLSNGQQTSAAASSYTAPATVTLGMKNAVGNDTKVKAAGGIRDIETARAMIDAGADRLGTSKLLI